MNTIKWIAAFTYDNRITLYKYNPSINSQLYQLYLENVIGPYEFADAHDPINLAEAVGNGLTVIVIN